MCGRINYKDCYEIIPTGKITWKKVELFFNTLRDKTYSALRTLDIYLQ